MSIKEGSFIEIDYEARIASNNRMFDTTKERIAKQNGLEGSPKPQRIIIGAQHVIKGLDAELKKHTVGDSFSVIIPAQDAFGSRNQKLVRLIPLKEFREKNMRPLPGMVLDFQGVQGTIMSASGGRVRVDFNHPLAGRTVVYDVTINREITDKKEQIGVILDVRLNEQNPDITIADKKATITLAQKLPEHYTKHICEEIEKYTGLKAEFVKKEEKKEDTTEKKPAKTPAKKADNE
ncbi:peptidylprolyl isomerase [archaeon CG10_big_fil_rev_8_21_14_0_10_43_11]|nr:MAG: peptidylprolyl isomerase [archaeon CG10_big_fil_rev_8_21_14_0_10_43_11]